MTTPEPARLREVLAASGLTTREIAARTGMTQKNVWEITAGKKDPRLSTVARVLAALGATWADLDPRG